MPPPSVPIIEELLTESQVVSRIPGRDADVRKWLRSLRIARRSPTDLRIYRWGEVLAFLPLEGEALPEPEPKQRRPALRRSDKL